MKLLIFLIISYVAIPIVFVVIGVISSYIIPSKTLKSSLDKILPATVIILVISAALWFFGQQIPDGKWWELRKLLSFSSITLMIGWILPISYYLYLSRSSRKRLLNGNTSDQPSKEKVEYYLITLPGYIIIATISNSCKINGSI